MRKRADIYARAVQLPFCCRLDHRILLIPLGIIHAMAIMAPNRLNSKSVTVATATPKETKTKDKTCKKQNRNMNVKSKTHNITEK